MSNPREIDAELHACVESGAMAIGLAEVDRIRKNALAAYYVWKSERGGGRIGRLQLRLQMIIEMQRKRDEVAGIHTRNTEFIREMESRVRPTKTVMRGFGDVPKGKA